MDVQIVEGMKLGRQGKDGEGDMAAENRDSNEKEEVVSTRIW